MNKETEEEFEERNKAIRQALKENKPIGGIQFEISKEDSEKYGFAEAKS